MDNWDLGVSTKVTDLSCVLNLWELHEEQVEVFTHIFKEWTI